MNTLNKLEQLEGSVSLEPEVENFGFVTEVGADGSRILVIDDTWAVLDDMIKSTRSLIMDDRGFTTTFSFYRLSVQKDSNTAALLDWLRSQDSFDVIYIDGNLGTQGSGIKLAQRIREIDGLDFQPIGITTADSGFFEKNVSTSDGVRIHGKFDLNGEQAVRKMVRDIRDIKASSRDLFWTTLQRELIRDLGRGLALEAVLEKLGTALRSKYGVYAWYLRERRGNVLKAIACHDAYGAGEELNISDSLKFQIDFLDDVDHDPWIRKNNLTRSDCENRLGMTGHHAIAARVDTALGGGVKTMFTAFRKADSEPFQPSDARNLHHTTVLLRLAQAPSRMNERLSELSSTVNEVLASDTTSDMASEVLKFLHEQINQKILDQNGRAKITTRLFLRGSGELARWGRPGEQEFGTVGSTNSGRPMAIWVQNIDSVYVRTVLDKRAAICDDLNETEDGFVATVDWTRSYLTVPLEYDGAILGAINLESEVPSSYNHNDKVLVQAISRVAAASILNYRSRRFMSDLADLAAKSIDLSGEIEPDEILQDGARNLYRLCGFSDLLLFEPDEHDAAWNLVNAWHGDGRCISPRSENFITSMSSSIKEDWGKTYIFECLSDKTGRRVFLKAGSDVGISDVGTLGFRKTNRPTLSRLVIVVGEDVNVPRQAMMLLFEHKFPIPDSFFDMLEKYAQFIAAVYSGVIEEVQRFGEQISVARLEARQGKVYSQVRHSLASQLLTVTNEIDLGREEGQPAESTLSVVKDLVLQALRDFEKHRNLLKVPDPIEVDLRSVWDKVISGLGTRAQALSIELRPLIETLRVHADPSLVEFIIFNLVDNALTHGAKNGVKVIYAKIDEGSFLVCDDGLKIPSPLSERMFTLGVSTGSKGTGQGLYLAREIAQDLNGKLDYEHRMEMNCFRLTLPKGKMDG